MLGHHRPEIGRQLGARRRGDRRERAVAFDARTAVATQQRHERDRVAQLGEDQLTVGPAGSGPRERVATQSELDPDTFVLVRVRPLQRPPPRDELGPVQGEDERGDVPHLWGDAEVGVAERDEDLAEHTRRVVVAVGRERGAEVEVAVRRRAPRHRRAVRQTGVADREVLEVALVTPVGVEHAVTAVRDRRVDGLGDRRAHVRRPAEDREPARRPRRGPARPARGLVGRGPGVERVPRVVAPLADRHAVGQGGDAVGLAGEDVAPDEHLAPVELGERAQHPHPFEVVVDPLRRHLPRLVEADVDVAVVREVGEQLAEQVAHEGERRRVGRLDRGGGPVGLVGSRRHGQVPVLVVGEPPTHVAEAVLVRHQLDVALGAKRVDRTDLLGGHRAGVAPDHLVVAVGEGVLGVQLDLVDLPRREPVDQREERLHRRYLVARDVDHHRPDGDIGPVLDLPDRQPAVVLTLELREGRPGVLHARGIRGVDAHRVLGDRDRVALGRDPRCTELDARLTPRDGAVLQVDVAGDRQQVHRSSLRWTKNTRPTVAPMRAYGTTGPTQPISARARPSARIRCSAPSNGATPTPCPSRSGRTATGPIQPARFTSYAADGRDALGVAGDHEGVAIGRAHELELPVRPVLGRPRLDLVARRGTGGRPAPGVRRHGGEVEVHVEVRLDPPVAQPFEQAEQRGLARLDARPQVEGPVRARRHGLQPHRPHVGLAGRDQGPPDAVASMLRRDHEDPDEALAGRAGCRAAPDRGDQPDVGIAADDGGLLRGEEGPVELLDRGGVEQ